MFFYKPLYEYIDNIYFMKYMVESLGISYELITVTDNIYNQVKDKVNINHLDEIIYTGYNWDFDKKEFIKSNMDEKYPLYIKIINSKKSYGFTYRNIKKEKDNTDIIINLSITIPNKVLHRVIKHELLHCKELYILKDKNIIETDKTNVYCSPYLDDDFKKLTKDLFYPLSNTEQHTIIQEIYEYVYNNNITKTNLIDKNISKISMLPKFYLTYRYFINFIGYNIYVYDLTILRIGYHLKKRFGYKNRQITKLFINDMYNEKIDNVNSYLLLDIMKYLDELIKIFQYKLYRTTYFAIQDRDNNIKH